MTIAIATGTGLRKEIQGKVIGFGGHIQILNYQPNPTLDQVPVSLSDSLLIRLKGRSEITDIVPFAQKAGIIKSNDLFEGAVLKGVNKEFNWGEFEQYITSGKLLRLNDSTYNDSILISQTLANKLGLAMGQKLSMYFVRESPKPPLLRYFYVQGVYQTDFEEIDNNFIIGDIKHIQRLNKWASNEVSGYEVSLTDLSLMDPVTKEIRLLMPYDVEALSAKQLNEQLFQWLKLFDKNIYLILAIMIAVATINMSIALLILILERTQTVGILKALGSSNLTVRKIFLVNAGYLIFRGLLWGNIIGIGLCLIQQQFGLIKLDPTVYFVSEVSIDLNPLLLILLNLGTVLICLVCLILPSYLITRISPVKAIRFD